MSSGSSTSSDIYRKAFDRFIDEVQYYLGQANTYFADMGTGERLLALCAFIMFLMYLIISRARRKYNPGSHGRQFAAAVLLVCVIAFGGGVMFGDGGGKFSGIFSI